jgi:hypothetical protein
MTKGQANVLRVFAVWTVFVWGTRIKNVFDQDRDWKFVTVHVILALVSVAFAAATWWIVTQNRGRNAPKLSSNSHGSEQNDNDSSDNN